MANAALRLPLECLGEMPIIECNLVNSLPTVVLRHELPDGSNHLDWMIAQDADRHQRLMTFRLNARPDLLHSGQTLPAVRIEDHRSEYLDYEGPVSGGRGLVLRVGSGRVTQFQTNGGSPDEYWRLAIQWINLPGSHMVQRLEMRRQPSSLWLVICSSIDRCVVAEDSRVAAVVTHRIKEPT